MRCYHISITRYRRRNIGKNTGCIKYIYITGLYIGFINTIIVENVVEIFVIVSCYTFYNSRIIDVVISTIRLHKVTDL